MQPPHESNLKLRLSSTLMAVSCVTHNSTGHVTLGVFLLHSTKIMQAAAAVQIARVTTACSCRKVNKH